MLLKLNAINTKFETLGCHYTGTRWAEFGEFWALGGAKNMGSLYLLNSYTDFYEIWSYDVGPILRPYLEGGHEWSMLPWLITTIPDRRTFRLLDFLYTSHYNNWLSPMNDCRNLRIFHPWARNCRARCRVYCINISARPRTECRKTLFNSPSSLSYPITRIVCPTAPPCVPTMLDFPQPLNRHYQTHAITPHLPFLENKG